MTDEPEHDPVSTAPGEVTDDHPSSEVEVDPESWVPPTLRSLGPGPADQPLDPDPGPGEPWRRRYRLNRWTTRWGPVGTVVSDDIGMDDPATRRLWLRIDVLLAALVAIALVAIVVALVR